jgi:uncharacterized protein (TIGR02266 family)
MSQDISPMRSRKWCRTCCTLHDPAGFCPGELLASGVERYGWRVAVRTSYGAETLGVLVAPVGKRWRARILTYPNVLWMIPGGGGAIKFIADDPAGAERAAIDFIRAHCEQRGFGIVSKSAAVESGPIDREQTEEAATSEAVLTSQRKLRALRVRYGVNALSVEGMTGDVSEGGIFIAADATFAQGTPLDLELEIEGCTIPLRGVVTWSRERAETGRPAGMGVDLVEPPMLYRQFVRSLS